MAPETVEKSNANRRQILQSTFSSTDDLEAMRSPSLEQHSPYISSNESTDDLALLHLRGNKHQSRHKRQCSWGSIGSKEGHNWSIPPFLKRPRNIISILGLVGLLVLVSTWWHKRGSIKVPKWVKPEGFKIIGFVFYGRPPTVSILDCYLKKNLVSNGGFLDEVHWFANTDNEYDLRYLDTLTNSSESYRKREMNETGFKHIWENAIEPGNMYLKIDDDMVYIGDDAIPSMVYAKLNHPEAFNIAANIVNSPLTNWFHWHRDAIHPYLPETTPPFNTTTDAASNNEWRASKLPLWNGTAPDKFDFGQKEDKFEYGQVGAPPFKGHRWLPLPDTSENLRKTPIAEAEYNAWGRALNRWPIAAQQHYSFLENLEKNLLERYWFAGSDGLWNMQYDRYNLNFILMWGDDVLLQPAPNDDEFDFTVTIPKNHSRPLLIDTHAIVAHFSFGPQREVYDTDLLSRYRAYANEMVCAPDNQLKALELHYK